MDGYGARCVSDAPQKTMSYHDYLKSKPWHLRRAEARRRARNRCRVCGTSEELHTHHKTYKHLGSERQHELVVLCKTHHFACHDFIEHWRSKGWKPLSDYALTMKYVARARKKERAK